MPPPPSPSKDNVQLDAHPGNIQVPALSPYTDIPLIQTTPIGGRAGTESASGELEQTLGMTGTVTAVSAHTATDQHLKTESVSPRRHLGPNGHVSFSGLGGTARAGGPVFRGLGRQLSRLNSLGSYRLGKNSARGYTSPAISGPFGSATSFHRHRGSGATISPRPESISTPGITSARGLGATGNTFNFGGYPTPTREEPGKNTTFRIGTFRRLLSNPSMTGGSDEMESRAATGITDSLADTRVQARNREHEKRARLTTVAGHGIGAEAWGSGFRAVQKKTWFLGFLPAMTEILPAKVWAEAGFGPRVEELLQHPLDEVTWRYDRFGNTFRNLDGATSARYRTAWAEAARVKKFEVVPKELREYVQLRREQRDFIVAKLGSKHGDDPSGEDTHYQMLLNGILDNVVSGFLTGIKIVLAGVVYATLVFNSKGEKDSPARLELEKNFGLGITLMLWTSLISGLWNAFFGRLQYSICGARIVPAVILAEISEELALDADLNASPEKIVPTLISVVCITSLSTGIMSWLVGYFRVADVVLRMPTPVTAGFLASVGWSAMRSSIKMASSIPWYNPAQTPGRWWPKDWGTDAGFFSLNSISAVLCAIAMFLGIKFLAPECKKCPGKWHSRFWNLIWTMLPLGFFYIAIISVDLSLSSLRGKWVFEKAEESTDFYLVWAKMDISAVKDIPSGVMVKMIIFPLLTIIASLLTLMASTAAFPQGHPDGSPDQYEQIDYSQEMRSIGFANILTGLTGGIGTYHVIGFTIDHRNDGGTHRLSILVSMLVVGCVFFASVGATLASHFPKFFVAGIYLNMGWVLFDKGVLEPFESLGCCKKCKCRAPRCCGLCKVEEEEQEGSPRGSPASKHDCCRNMFPCFDASLAAGLSEWSVTVVCILVAMFTELIWGVVAAIVLAFIIHIQQVSAERPFASERSGHASHVRSTRKRSEWENNVLSAVGSRAVILELKGALFFGTVESVSKLLEKVLSANAGGEGTQEVEYIILDFTKVVSIDGSAGKLFSRLKQSCKRARVTLVFSGIGISQAVATAIQAFRIADVTDASDQSFPPEPEEGYELQKASAWQASSQVQIRGVWFNCKVIKKERDVGSSGYVYDADLGGEAMAEDIETNVPGVLIRQRKIPGTFPNLDAALDWVEATLLDDYYYKQRRLMAADFPSDTGGRLSHHFGWLENVLLFHLINPRDLLVPPTWGQAVTIDWSNPRTAIDVSKRTSLAATLGITIQNLRVDFVVQGGWGKILGIRKGMMITCAEGEPVLEKKSSIQDDADLETYFRVTKEPRVSFQLADRVWHAAPAPLSDLLSDEHDRIASLRLDPIDMRPKTKDNFAADEFWDDMPALRTDLDAVSSWLHSEAIRWRIDQSLIKELVSQAMDVVHGGMPADESQRMARRGSTRPVSSIASSVTPDVIRAVTFVEQSWQRAQSLRSSVTADDESLTTEFCAASDDQDRLNILVQIRTAQLLASVAEASVAMLYRNAADGAEEVADEVMASMLGVSKETLFELSTFCYPHQYEPGDTVFSPGANTIRHPRRCWRKAKVIVKPTLRNVDVPIRHGKEKKKNVDKALGITLSGLTVSEVTQGPAWRGGVRVGWVVYSIGANAALYTVVHDREHLNRLYDEFKPPFQVSLQLKVTQPCLGEVVSNLRTETGVADELGKELWLHKRPGVWHTEAPLDTIHLVELEDKSLGIQEFSDDECLRLDPSGSPIYDATAMCFIRQGALDTTTPGSYSEDQTAPDREAKRMTRQGAGNGAGEAQFLLSGEGNPVPHSSHTFVVSKVAKLWVFTFEKYLQMQQPTAEGGNPELYAKVTRLFLSELASDALNTDTAQGSGMEDLWDGSKEEYWGLEFNGAQSLLGGSHLDAAWV
eukprot:Hpha_TRINITY_DN15329_c4_g1::TRINITY_DN15329_c4_g1_i1::g.89447::m.89447